MNRQGFESAKGFYVGEDFFGIRPDFKYFMKQLNLNYGSKYI